MKSSERGVILVLVDPHKQHQRTVQDCSSRGEGLYVLDADAPVRDFGHGGGLVIE